MLEVQFWEFYDGEKGKNMICVEFRIEFCIILNFAFLVWRFAVVWKGVLLKYDLC